MPDADLPPSGKPLIVVGGLVAGGSLAYMGLLKLASAFCCESGAVCLGGGGPPGSCRVNYLGPAAVGLGGLALMLVGVEMEDRRNAARIPPAMRTAFVPTVSSNGAGVACIGQF